MNIHGKHYRTIWVDPQRPEVVQVIDQRLLPFEFKVLDLTTVDAFAYAIKEMVVRGAGLIGATAAYGMYCAALNAPRHSREAFLTAIRADGSTLTATRPTAINLAWAVERQWIAMQAAQDIEEMIRIAFATAQQVADEDADFCRRIGEHGVSLIEAISQRKGGETVNVLTHCNAGWLAFVDYGSATAPIYAAHDRGIKVHVWVDETRPRNQGARLTAWELGEHGVDHHVVVDNAGGHLMQHDLVDLVIVGSDRTTYTGDVANKIGTYLKALAAHDNHVPFYAALPSSTFDWKMRDGVREIPIEERNPAEVTMMSGLHDGQVVDVQITPADSPVGNYGFDVTPARLVTGLITERGICAANEAGVLTLYPEKKS
ncbi:MAG: S-methyl-5-thioribose-1-phosphate isomerase [Chloroflexi bacterium]|nr:S-methyl-5-thioribose-1-phosphate isomerase [Chloroflexota bacterium]